MNIRKLTTLAILLAVNTVIGFFDLPIMGNFLRISFTFFIHMFIAAKFSLANCILYAALEDVISFLISSAPRGDVFFPGYTLSAVLALIIYWVFLHKEVNLKNTFLSRLSVNIFVNAVIGSLWRTVLYSKGYIYYLSTSLVKNLILVFIEVPLFLLFYRYISPIYEKYRKDRA